MPPSELNFNQLIDSAVNPSLGTINTSLLHNLLHIIINQLQVSSSNIELHGAGCAANGNQIVHNQHHCGWDINEFGTKEEADDADGSIVERRKEIRRTEIDEATTKLSTIEKVKQKAPQADGNNDVAIPSDEEFINADTPGSSLIPLINASTRIESLEMEKCQLTEILKTSQCDVTRCDAIKSEIVQTLASMQNQADNLSNQTKLNCKCNDEGYRDSLFDEFHEKIIQEMENNFSTMDSQMEDLKGLLRASLEESQSEMKRFEDSVCDRLKAFKNDFVSCMREVQKMLDAKLDKISVGDLKNFISDKMKELEERIDCQKPRAAGVVNCVSCGVNVS